MTKTYRDYLLMFLILDYFNDENPSENVITYLTDANPYMRKGENSLDVVVYNEFKKKYEEYENHDDYSYEFIKEYLKELDYYKGIYELFKTIKKEEYLNLCKEILTNQSELLEK